MKIKLSEIESSAKDFAEIVLDDTLVCYYSAYMLNLDKSGYRAAENEKVRPVIEALHSIYNGKHTDYDIATLRNHMKGIVQSYVDSGTVIDDDEDALCANCNGSGEGMHDGARCNSCGGSGVYSLESHEERMAYEADFRRDQMRDELMEKGA